MTEVAPEGAPPKNNKDPEMSVPTDEMGNGPVANRGCTDILCCLVFLAFLVGMVGTAGYGILYGDPLLLVTLADADGNGCGYDPATKEYPYLYYPTIDPRAMQNASASVDPKGAVTQMLAFGACVTECPKKDGPIDCKPPTYMSRSEEYYKDCVFSPIEWKYHDGEFAFRYETKLVGGKVCSPSPKALEGEDETAKALRAFTEQFDKYLGDDNPLM